MGGRIFENTSRINQENVQPTYKSILERTSLDESKCSLLGSSGLKETSGDIDIGVDNSIIDLQDLKVMLESIYGESNVRRITNGWSVPVKVVGSDGFVQVDFMLGDLEFMELYYFYDPRSKFKGVHRNIALNAVAAEVSRKIINPDLDDFGRHKEEERYKWSPKYGLIRINRRSKDRQDNGKTVRKQEDQIIGKSYHTWKDVSETLFGSGALDKYIESTESIISAVKLKFSKEMQEKIFSRIAKDFSNNKAVSEIKWDYPTEIASRIEAKNEERVG